MKSTVQKMNPTRLAARRVASEVNRISDGELGSVRVLRALGSRRLLLGDLPDRRGGRRRGAAPQVVGYFAEIASEAARGE